MVIAFDISPSFFREYGKSITDMILIKRDYRQNRVLRRR